MSMPSQSTQMRRYLWRFAEVAALLILVLLFCIVAAWSLAYVLPFVAGGFFAILLMPLVRSLERRGVGRPIAVLTVVVSIVVLLVIASTFVVVAVAREATMWTTTITSQFDQIQTWVTQQVGLGRVWFGQFPPTVSTEIEHTAVSALTTLQTLFSNFAKGLIQSVTHLPDYMFVAVIALIATYFMLVNRDHMYSRFLEMLPPGWSDKVKIVTDDMMRAFVGTIRVQVLLMLMSMVLGIVGMWVLGIQYAVILGILFGLAGIVPILGSAIITIPWAVGALLIGDVSLALKVLLLQLAISLIRHMVEPKLLADSVGLDTLSTLFALYVGMQLIGVLGLFLGPIVLIGIKSLFRIRLFIDFFPVPVETESGCDSEGQQRTP